MSNESCCGRCLAAHATPSSENLCRWERDHGHSSAPVLCWPRLCKMQLQKSPNQVSAPLRCCDAEQTQPHLLLGLSCENKLLFCVCFSTCSQCMDTSGSHAGLPMASPAHLLLMDHLLHSLHCFLNCFNHFPQFAQG